MSAQTWPYHPLYHVRWVKKRQVPPWRPGIYSGLRPHLDKVAVNMVGDSFSAFPSSERSGLWVLLRLSYEAVASCCPQRLSRRKEGISRDQVTSFFFSYVGLARSVTVLVHVVC
jgi:hypothetical protein